MNKEFTFVISGYNNNNEACQLFNYKNGVITNLDNITLDNPSFVISHKNLVFTYTKNPLEMLAYEVLDNKFKLIDRIKLDLQSMTHLYYSDKNECLYGASYLDGVLCKLDFKNKKFSNVKKINHKELYGIDSKCHCVTMNNDQSKVLCVNIATSALYIYDINLNLDKIIQLHEGCGPRHAIWDGNLIYAITEYSNELIVIDDEGAIQYLSTINTDVKSYGGTLFKKDNYIYASNRGEETIAKFEIQEDGKVKYVNSFSVNGAHSRHMIEYKDIIISCNKNSHNVSFIDINDEKEIVTLKYSNPSGVCIIE